MAVLTASKSGVSRAGSIFGFRFSDSDRIGARSLPISDEYSEKIEDEYLLAIAEERLKNDNGITHAAEDVYAELGIDNDDTIEVDID